MNLHNIVRTAIRAVNPDRPATLLRSAGYTTDASGRQQPAYQRLCGLVQVQGMNPSDLRHAEFLNLQGTLRAVYLLGNWAGAVRVEQKGGDVLEFAESEDRPVQQWKVVSVQEAWPDWTKVIVCLQA